MLTVILSNIFFILFMLLLSAFFSGSEVALFSLKKSELHRLGASVEKRDNKIFYLMNNPQQLLITILTGNLFVNIILASEATEFFIRIAGDYGHFIAIFLITPVIIMFGEITPKIITVSNPLKFSKLSVNILYIIHKLFTPIRVLFYPLTHIMIKYFNIQKKDESSVTEKELDIAVRYTKKMGAIAPEECEFIKNVLKFSKKEASNAMIPRNDAVAIPADADVYEAIEIFKTTSVVRAPVYEGNIDNIIGILDSRVLLPYACGLKKGKSIKKLCFSVYHYPATKSLNELLDEFLKNKFQIAVLVDEYGGTAGIVTLSAIISELVGDEFSLEKSMRKSEPKKIGDSTYVISGDMQIDDFNDAFNSSFNSDETDTMAGFLIEKHEGFPIRGHVIEIDDFIFKIRNIRKNKIESIEIQRKEL